MCCRKNGIAIFSFINTYFSVKKANKYFKAGQLGSKNQLKYLGQPTWNEAKLMKFGLKKANMPTSAVSVQGRLTERLQQVWQSEVHLSPVPHLRWLLVTYVMLWGQNVFALCCRCTITVFNIETGILSNVNCRNPLFHELFCHEFTSPLCGVFRSVIFNVFHAATHFAIQFNLTIPFRKFPVRHMWCGCVCTIENHNDWKLIFDTTMLNKDSFLNSSTWQH